MPRRAQEVDLVLHQRDQRRDDQRHAVEQQRRQLVAERLAAAGREHRQRAAPGQQRLDHLGLAGPEASKPKRSASSSWAAASVGAVGEAEDIATTLAGTAAAGGPPTRLRHSRSARAAVRSSARASAVEVQDGAVGDDHRSLVGDRRGVRGAAGGGRLDLLLVARRRDRLEAIAARVTAAHGVSARVVEADLSDPAQLVALCTEAADLPLGLLVNNAALAHYMPFATLPPESAQELVQLNVLAPVLLTRAVLDGMRERGEGAVVNVASLLAFSGSWEKDYCRSGRSTRRASRS